MNTKILSLVLDGCRDTRIPRPKVDPLLEEDVLQEASLIGMLHDMANATVALLFDLRTSLYFADNTGLLVLRGVSQLTSSTEVKSIPNIWAISGSKAFCDETGAR